MKSLAWRLIVVVDSDLKVFQSLVLWCKDENMLAMLMIEYNIMMGCSHQIQPKLSCCILIHSVARECLLKRASRERVTSQS